MRDIAIIGTPVDLGQGRRGVDMGPSAIRYAGLKERLQALGFDVRDHGNVATTQPEAAEVGDEAARYLSEIMEACGRVASLVGEGFAAGEIELPALEPRRVVLVGVRSLDPAERELLRRLDAGVFTMSEIDRIGIERVLQEALDRVSGSPWVHVSLDLDVLDPEVAPGVGTPVRGGLTYREAHLALELIAEAGVAGS